MTSLKSPRFGGLLEGVIAENYGHRKGERTTNKGMVRSEANIMGGP
jgi:hypothetical protein